MLKRLESSVHEGTRLWARRRGGGGTIAVCLTGFNKVGLNRGLAAYVDAGYNPDVAQLLKRMILM